MTETDTLVCFEQTSFCFRSELTETDTLVCLSRPREQGSGCSDWIEFIHFLYFLLSLYLFWMHTWNTTTETKGITEQIDSGINCLFVLSCHISIWLRNQRDVYKCYRGYRIPIPESSTLCDHYQKDLPISKWNQKEMKEAFTLQIKKTGFLSTCTLMISTVLKSAVEFLLSDLLISLWTLKITLYKYLFHGMQLT